MEATSGLIAMETNVGVDENTVRTVELLAAPELAKMFARPNPAAVARPPGPTTATPDASEDQIADPVRSCVLPSVYVPVAVNCCEVPSEIAGFCGVSAIETRVAAVTVRLPEPLTDPDAAVIVTAPEARVLARP